VEERERKYVNEVGEVYHRWDVAGVGMQHSYSTPSQPMRQGGCGLVPMEVEIRLGYWIPLMEAHRITGV
jgi:hypothetical protein